MNDVGFVYMINSMMDGHTHVTASYTAWIEISCQVC